MLVRAKSKSYIVGLMQQDEQIYNFFLRKINKHHNEDDVYEKKNISEKKPNEYNMIYSISSAKVTEKLHTK